MNIPFFVEVYLIGMALSFVAEILEWSVNLLTLRHGRHCDKCSTLPTPWPHGIGYAVASSVASMTLWPLYAVVSVLAIPYLIYRVVRRARATRRAEADQQYVGAAGMTDGEES